MSLLFFYCPQLKDARTFFNWEEKFTKSFFNDLQVQRKDALVDDMMALDPYQVSNQMAMAAHVLLSIFALLSLPGQSKNMFFSLKNQNHYEESKEHHLKKLSVIIMIFVLEAFWESYRLWT